MLEHTKIICAGCREPFVSITIPKHKSRAGKSQRASFCTRCRYRRTPHMQQWGAGKKRRRTPPARRHPQAPPSAYGS